MEDIREFIIECLPTMGSEQLSQLLTLLTSLGVEELQHLSVVETEDLLGTLKVVQARLLKKKIDNTFNQGNNAPVRAEIAEGASNSEVSNGTSKVSNPEVQSDCSQDALMSLNFNKFSKSISNKLMKGERPTPTERREMVRIIVSQVMEVIAAPRKCHLQWVAAELVRLYPQSLKDAISNDTLGMGHSSLLCQLIAQTENCRRRPAGQNIKRKADGSNQQQAPKKVADSYGCANFQPTEYPSGETSKTLEEKKIFMQSQYNRVNNEAEITEYMQLTFICQRSAINNSASVSSILKEWPFLRERRHMMAHSKELMGICLKQKASASFATKFPEMKKFFMEEKLFKNYDFENLHFNYLELLATYFQEEVAYSLKMYEEGTLLDAVVEVPVTPFIACIGDPYSLSPVCTVILEKECMEKFIPLDDALIMWFATYYVFNSRIYSESAIWNKSIWKRN